MMIFTIASSIYLKQSYFDILDSEFGDTHLNNLSKCLRV